MQCSAVLYVSYGPCLGDSDALEKMRHSLSEGNKMASSSIIARGVLPAYNIVMQCKKCIIMRCKKATSKLDPLLTLLVELKLPTVLLYLPIQCIYDSAHQNTDIGRSQNPMQAKNRPKKGKGKEARPARTP